MTATPDRLLVSVPDACAALGGVSRSTVYDLASCGEIVKINIGRRGFIVAESLEAYVERLTEATKTSTTKTQIAPPLRT